MPRGLDEGRRSGATYNEAVVARCHGGNLGLMSVQTSRGSAQEDTTKRHVEQTVAGVAPLATAQPAQLGPMLVPAVEALARPHDLIAYPVPLAARLIGIGPLRTWDLVREGAIRSFTQDGRRLISRRALEEYVARREVEPA